MTNKTIEDLVKYVLVNDIPLSGVNAELTPDARDIELLGVFMPEGIKLTQFTAFINMTFLPGNEILHIEGTMTAELKTHCSISLEPMTISISEDIDIDFCKNIYEDDHNDETHLSPEKIINGRIDVYEIAIQTLMLFLPTHPTLKNATIDVLGYKPKQIDLEIKNEKPNPFDILKTLKEEK